MHGLSARAAIRGKRATKNIRKCRFYEVFFGLLERTNRSFVVFSGVFFGLLPSTNRSFCKFSEVFFDLLHNCNRVLKRSFSHEKFLQLGLNFLVANPEGHFKL